MTNTQQLHEILNAALEYETKSMLYWEYIKEAQNHGLIESENFNWATCREYDGRAKGLLDAYEVLTGRKISCLPSAINKEIESLLTSIYKSID